jgi:hypothetical protein
MLTFGGVLHFSKTRRYAGYMVLTGFVVSKLFTLVYPYDAGVQWHAVLQSFPAYLARCEDRVRQLY